SLHGARMHDLDPAALLREAGLSPSLLQASAERVTPAHYARLIRLLWLRLDDEYLGLAAQPSRPGTFAMMASSIIHCGTLERALRRGIRFYGLFPGSPGFSLRREGAHAWLCVQVDAQRDPQHFLSESLLLIWHRLASWLIGQRIALEEVCFAYSQPPHGAEYDLLFPGTRRFGAGFTRLPHCRGPSGPAAAAGRTHPAPCPQPGPAGPAQPPGRRGFADHPHPPPARPRLPPVAGPDAAGQPAQLQPADPASAPARTAQQRAGHQGPDATGTDRKSGR